MTDTLGKGTLILKYKKKKLEELDEFAKISHKLGQCGKKEERCPWCEQEQAKSWYKEEDNQ